MALVKSRAITLKAYRLGETSKVVVCYTREYGKVRLVAKGARKGGGRLGAALEPMLVSGVVFYLRQGRDLMFLSQAEVERQWPSLRRDVVRMAYAGVVLELTDALIVEHQPDAEVFDLIEWTLGRMAEVPETSLDPALWRFEILLAHALGYTPELKRCVVCGEEPSTGTSFAPSGGGMVCAGCASSEPGAVGMSEGAAEALPALSTRSERADTAPESGYEPKSLTDLTPYVRDEIGEMLVRFLGEHAGRELKPKSLDFLAQVRRAELASGESE